MNFSGSGKLQDRFHAIIPGGAHTYAKGDDQFPEFSEAVRRTQMVVYSDFHRAEYSSYLRQHNSEIES